MAQASRDEVRQFYDAFGAKQDRQGFYEDAAIDSMIELGGFSDAQAVFELGCGTGRLAARLLSDHLPASARYVGIDLSSTMVDLARKRLAPFAGRCEVHLSDGGFDFSSYGGPFDRVVATYVLDLLSRRDIELVLAEAHEAMSKGGLFCHAGLTRGSGPISRATSGLWTLVHRVKPTLVGGCRPLTLADLMPRERWRVIHREVVVSAAIPSEIVIAAPR
jgi:SAM-dependent methyltransferase